MRLFNSFPLISSILFALQVSGWTARLPATTGGTIARRSIATPASVKLHPDQAQELAACAYDLMKQATEERAKGREQQERKIQLLSGDISRKLRLEEEEGEQDASHRATGGPVSWARRRLWHFARNSKLPQQHIVIHQDVKPGMMP